MKKLTAFVFGLLIVSPSLVFAQTMTPAAKAQLIAALYAEVAVIEQEIQQIIAAQQQIQATQATQSQQIQQIVQSTTPTASTNPVAAPVVTTTQPVVTPPQYPTPEVTDVVNNNATFSTDDSVNGYTAGTFTIAYSNLWRLNAYPIKVSSPLINSVIIQLQGNGQDCFQEGQIVNCAPFLGQGAENLMIGLDELPPPGSYTITIPSISIEDENTYANMSVGGTPLIFTFQVSAPIQPLGNTEVQQESCINTADANAISAGEDASQAMATAVIACPQN